MLSLPLSGQVAGGGDEVRYGFAARRALITVGASLLVLSLGGCLWNPLARRVPLDCWATALVRDDYGDCWSRLMPPPGAGPPISSNASTGGSRPISGAIPSRVARRGTRSRWSSSPGRTATPAACRLRRVQMAMSTSSVPVITTAPVSPGPYRSPRDSSRPLCLQRPPALSAACLLHGMLIVSGCDAVSGEQGG